MVNTVLGVMVCRLKNQLFHEQSFYRFLQQAGAKRNMLIYVFYPDQIDWSTRKVNGLYYNHKSMQWKRKKFPIPNFVYDRCFYTKQGDYSYYQPFITKLKNDNNIHFLGNSLKGKWQVYQIISTNKQYQKYLPLTTKYRNTTQLLKWLKEFPIILKPIGGSHGKGVIKIYKLDGKYHILGRDHYNKKISLSFSTLADLSNYIKVFTQKGRFLIQQYLSLTTSNDLPYDIRVFIQKNQNGQWEPIGMAARIGETNNITSNLHGGGSVDTVISLLTREFGERKANSIIAEINSLAKNLPMFIEQIHGELFELGLDIGVDRTGRVWIIEVNSKPGRNVFLLLNEKEIRRKSLIMPILYTEFLNKKKIGGNVI